jgi:hypothetical protein
MAEIRETGAGHQPYIARANHGNPHESIRLLWLMRPPLKAFRRKGKSEYGMALERIKGKETAFDP